MAARCCVSCKYPPLILSFRQASLYLSLDFAVFGFNLLFWAFWSNQRQRHQNDNSNAIEPPTTTKWRQDSTSTPQNRDQPISGSTRSPTLCFFTPLKFAPSSRMSPRTSQSSPSTPSINTPSW